MVYTPTPIVAPPMYPLTNPPSPPSPPLTTPPLPHQVWPKQCRCVSVVVVVGGGRGSLGPQHTTDGQVGVGWWVGLVLDALLYPPPPPFILAPSALSYALPPSYPASSHLSPSLQPSSIPMCNLILSHPPLSICPRIPSPNPIPRAYTALFHLASSPQLYPPILRRPCHPPWASFVDFRLR